MWSLSIKYKNKRTYLLNFILRLVSLFCFNIEIMANPVSDENLNTGSRGWVLSGDGSGHDATDLGVQIKGYMSATSVNKGGQIDFKVSVNPAQNFTIEIYRVGWYGSNGGRLMQTIGPIAGISQAPCPRDEAIGIIDCNWSTSYRLTVPTAWTSGIYLAKLKNVSGFDSGTIFVVRDDNRTADFLYQQPVTTYHAYNQYPEGVNGKSLYANMLGESGAYKVSFNRPYAGYRSSSNGYGDFPLWELMLVKWLEKGGYDIVYSTDVDTHTNGANLKNHKGFISAGHDEYWSKEMVDAAQSARDNGTNLIFFGANASYWQVRFEADNLARPNRVLVCYRSSDIDPITNPSLKTDLFRSTSVNRPEQHLLGLQYISYNNLWQQSNYTNFTVKNSNHWAYQGTGLMEGQNVAPIIGYEIDHIDPAVPLPVNTEYTVLAESPFRSIYGDNLVHNSVIYKAPNNGGWVFSTGTMSWSWALDYDAKYSYLGDRRSAALQTVTQNIMNHFVGVNHAPQGLPIITGLPEEHQTLSVDIDDITDPDGLGPFSYQWLRDGLNITGAITNTYHLDEPDEGKQISVVVTYTDGLGKLERLVSAPTPPVTEDDLAPTVSITSPIPGSTISGSTVVVSANANDSDGIVGVQFKLDGANLGVEDTAAPYSIIFDSMAIVNGYHTLTAIARDPSGNIATSSLVTVNVNNTGTNPLPDVVVTGLVYSNGVFTSTIKNQGTASTPAGVTIGVGYSVDGIYKTWGARTTALAAGVSATISTNGGAYAIPSGAHTITAKVDDVNRFAELDEANNSLTLPLTVNSGDSVLPTVTINAPANNSTISGATVAVTVTATDNVAVAGVQFKLDGVNLGVEDTSAPYGLTWDSSTVANSSHTITAIARDTAGNLASSAVTVNVSNTSTTLPDVVVTALTYSSGVFTSTIKNQGTKATPTGVTIGVGYSVDGAYKTWGARSTSLAAGASATISTNGAAYAIPSGAHTITANVDDVNRFAELDEVNNKLTQQITIP